MRPAGKARRPSIPVVCEGGATPPRPGSPTRQPRWGGGGMQRRSNADGVAPRVAKLIRMAIKDGLLAEFDHEMGTTRKLLERLPEEKLSWKPHDRSMSMGGLATHLANLPP